MTTGNVSVLICYHIILFYFLNRSPSYLDCIESVLGSSPTMIMCIVPNNSADRYSAIKKKCCVDRGVPTQVIVARTLQNPKGMCFFLCITVININS